MSITKRIRGEYLLTNKDSIGSNVTIATTTLYVDGNLIVGGNSTTVSKTDLNVTDNTIVLNAGETGAGVTLVYAGIQVDRGSLTDVQLRWNETTDSWQLTNNGTTFSNISVQGGTTQANIDVAQYSIYSSNFGNVKFDDNVSIKNTTVVPSAFTGYNTLYSQTPAGGGSGLFVTNSTVSNQELVTKTKAIVYALIM